MIFNYRMHGLDDTITSATLYKKHVDLQYKKLCKKQADGRWQHYCLIHFYRNIIQNTRSYCLIHFFRCIIWNPRSYSKTQADGRWQQYCIAWFTSSEAVSSNFQQKLYTVVSSKICNTRSYCKTQADGRWQQQQLVTHLGQWTPIHGPTSGHLGHHHTPPGL